MKIPTIHGNIERRILINYTADPAVVQQLLPFPFRPKIYKDKAIAGICLIRLKNIKPKGFPDLVGVSSENGAHRIAVEWDEGGEVREGVYIPRRDTSLRLNTIVGGWLFPGVHHLAKFNVEEANGQYHIDFVSADQTGVSIDAKEVELLTENSIFQTLDEASLFFEKGSLGYSPNKKQFDGLKLQTYRWEMRALEVSQVSSSFFEDQHLFPKGSVVFDHALLMTEIEHEWHSVSTPAEA
ncbi:DUF2071 domain-containing protein [Pedobacter caeni]|uniref:Uncharacterized conserved protein (COG2071) n=1 Tax=Pedobacter caeni TaxID=288992 RepID=A0A1M4WKH1_9SPHI|nr:DUF2071 domain-containing protein [Pedobacter caeni]SHE81543.1 Uncharacterized conserved protein (COG2071) [Pedobacter caeni]